MSKLIEVENGEVEFVGTPGHVNVIATDHDASVTVELRLPPGDGLDGLAWGLRRDQPVRLELSDGIVEWEPQRGLYVEDYGRDEMYLICSPEQREALGNALAEVKPL